MVLTSMSRLWAGCTGMLVAGHADARGLAGHPGIEFEYRLSSS